MAEPTIERYLASFGYDHVIAVLSDAAETRAAGLRAGAAAQHHPAGSAKRRGVAALLFQARPGATVAEVEAALQSTCLPLKSGSPSRYGFGLLNPREALKKLNAL